jgi:hypothetical protein
MLMLEPVRIKLRTEKLLPKFIASKTEAFPAIFISPSKLQPEPNRANERIERLLPPVIIPRTETA